MRFSYKSLTLMLPLLALPQPGFADQLNGADTAWIMTSTALVLFMTLPGPMHALDGWDSMLATARRVGEILQADLLDEQRSPFSRQREAQIREEMREYDRKKNPAT